MRFYPITLTLFEWLAVHRCDKHVPIDQTTR